MMSRLLPPLKCGEIIDIVLRGSVRKNSRLSTLQNEREKFLSNSRLLEEAIAKSTIDDIDELDFFDVATEASYIYKKYLRDIDDICDKIFSITNGKCVYCLLGQATEIDHFFPKDIFYFLAIDPWNLVPCCGPCNRHKGKYYGVDKEGKFSLIHPYSDEKIPKFLSLDFRFCHNPKKIEFEFKYEDFEHLDGKKQERLINHLDKLRLLRCWSKYISITTFPIFCETIRNSLTIPKADKKTMSNVVRVAIKDEIKKFGDDRYNDPRYVFFCTILGNSELMNEVIEML